MLTYIDSKSSKYKKVNVFLSSTAVLGQTSSPMVIDTA
jgi:hypothetical protein